MAGVPETQAGFGVGWWRRHRAPTGLPIVLRNLSGVMADLGSRPLGMATYLFAYVGGGDLAVTGATQGDSW